MYSHLHYVTRVIYILFAENILKYICFFFNQWTQFTANSFSYWYL